MLNHKNKIFLFKPISIFLLIVTIICIIWTRFTKTKESFNIYDAVNRKTDCYLFCKGKLMNCPFECNQKKLTSSFP
jgi:penicillin-binding protein-related factor A (putative recombinase)